MSVEDFVRKVADHVQLFGISAGATHSLVAEHDKEVLDAYKQRVLAAALECQESENWCDEGLHQALRALDIEPPKKDWEVNVEVKAYQQVTVVVEAATEDEAMRLANDTSYSRVMELCEAYGWHHDAHEAEEAWVA